MKKKYQFLIGKVLPLLNSEAEKITQPYKVNEKGINSS